MTDDRLQGVFFLVGLGEDSMIGWWPSATNDANDPIATEEDQQFLRLFAALPRFRTYHMHRSRTNVRCVKHMSMQVKTVSDWRG